MNPPRIPEFAIVGHPNEGKSSVVSTLAEDDSVRVSPIPGETIECQGFPVVIDGREIIRFIDTPGFQNPVSTLAWMNAYRGPDDQIVSAFRQNHIGNPDFRDDCELFAPIAMGAGVIYVVDGSRPLRQVDRAEMEVLRLTGRPRMAIINCKHTETRYLEDWKNAFRKHFNAIRLFNAHKATYAERIDLLETLKSIDPDWAPALSTVIAAFKQDWERRCDQSADIIRRLLEDCLTHKTARNFTDPSDEEAVKQALQTAYNQDIESFEVLARKRIRGLFKHNIFNLELPPYSILHEDLFNEKTWQLLGLTPVQLITAAGLSGAAIGAAVDIAAHGLTFGIFTAIGGLAGAGWAALGGGRKLSRSKMVGLRLGGHQYQIGPAENIQFLYVLLDRILIYCAHTINWAHGRRDYPPPVQDRQPVKAGLTTEWDDKTQKACAAFLKAVRGSDEDRKAEARREMAQLIKSVLSQISTTDRRYGLVMNGNP